MAHELGIGAGDERRVPVAFGPNVKPPTPARPGIRRFNAKKGDATHGSGSVEPLVVFG